MSTPPFGTPGPPPPPPGYNPATIGWGSAPFDPYARFIPSWPKENPWLQPAIYPSAPITYVRAVNDAAIGKRSALRVPTWGLWDLAIILGLWLICAVVGSMIYFLGSNGSATLKGALLILTVVLPWIALIGWPLFITNHSGNGLRIDLGLRWSWRDIGMGVGYGVISLIVASMLGALTTMIFGQFDSAAGELGEDLAKTSPVLVIVFTLTVAVGAPIAEEICFRGFMYSSLAKKNLRPWITIVVTAAVFAAFHGEAVRFILLFGIGLVLGFGRYQTGSLTTTIVAHAVNNTPSALYLLITSLH